MARCPFANHSVPGKSPGPFKGGPFKLVLHTTEGSSAAGAFAAYRSKRIWPHFTIEETRIWQHVDTSVSSSAVLNRSGSPETNRLSAIQIEMVAFAGQRKDETTLASTARVGRWLEAWHSIPRRWPAGRPQGNAGPHNRSRQLWTTQGGWYGHSQVPENTHWDPGRLSDKELAILMGEREEGGPLRVNHVDQSEIFERGEHWAIIKDRTWVQWEQWRKFAGYEGSEYDAATDSPDLITDRTQCEVFRHGVRCTEAAERHVALTVTGDNAVNVWACAKHINELEGIVSEP